MRNGGINWTKGSTGRIRTRVPKVLRGEVINSRQIEGGHTQGEESPIQLRGIVVVTGWLLDSGLGSMSS